MTIEGDITALAPGAIVEFFEIDLTPLGGPLLFFHAGTNQLRAPVVWQGNAYQPFPIQATGFEWSGKGQLPRPKLTVANVTGLITGYALEYQDFLGAQVTRHRTLVKYLDAVNFPGGVNASADPTQFLPDEIYFVNQRTQESKAAVQFELAASFDVAGVQLPRRQIIQNVCPWKYKGPECSWAPSPTTGPWFDANDNSVSSAAQDQCSKRLTGCQARFGQYSPLPYGGFPAASLVNLATS